MALRRSSDGTLYRQLVDLLLSRIARGELKPGEQLPTEQALCEQFGVSRTTARRSLDELRRVGVASRQPGRGSFVAEPNLHAAMPYLHSFTDEIRRLGYRPGAVTLLQRTMPATDEVAADLSLAVGMPVLQVRRLRTADDQPIFVVDSFFNTVRFPGLLDLDLSVLSIYSAIEDELRVSILRAAQWTAAEAASSWVVRALGMRSGAPVLAMRRITYAAGDIPIETVRAYFHGKRYTSYVELLPPPMRLLPPLGRPDK